MKYIQEWFDQHELFDLNEPWLRSLSSGLTASDGDGVNCEKTEEVGEAIQKLDNMNIAEGSIKRSDHWITCDHVRSLDNLLPGIKVDKQKVHVHPNYLFCRLIAMHCTERGRH